MGEGVEDGEGVDGVGAPPIGGVMPPPPLAAPSSPLTMMIPRQAVMSRSLFSPNNPSADTLSREKQKHGISGVGRGKKYY